ncbi:MAG: NHL repeat-containing protein [Bacteroidota bacterium]
MNMPIRWKRPRLLFAVLIALLVLCAVAVKRLLITTEYSRNPSMLLQNSKRKASATKVTLKLLKTFGDSKEAYIAEASDIAVDEEGTVYIADRLLHQVIVYDRMGKFIRTFGRRGKGPGEFENPTYISYWNGRIAVGTSPSPRVQIFDKSFKYLTSFYVPSPITGLRFGLDGSLWITTAGPDRNRILTRYDQKGKPVSSIGPQGVPSTGNYVSDQWYMFFWMDISHQGVVALASAVKNDVQLYSAQGQLIGRFSVPGLPKEVDWGKLEGIDWNIPSGVMFFRICFDRTGKIFLLSESSQSGNRAVYVMEQDGTFITQFLLPEPTRVLYVDADNNLYLTANKGILLKKYKIIYN